MELFQAILDGLRQVGTDLAAMGGWVWWALTAIGFWIMFIIGKKILGWARKQADEFVQSGPDFFWPLLWTGVLTILFVIVAIAAIASWAYIGRFAIEAFVWSAENNVTLPAPPDRDPSNNSTGATGAQPTAQPTQESGATAPPAAENFSTAGTYYVSDTSGATTRPECNKDSEPSQTLPYNTTVTFSSFVASNTVGGVSQRAVIETYTLPDGAPALSWNPVGMCLHMAAIGTR